MSEPGLNVLLLAGKFEVRASSAYTIRLATHLPEHAVRPRIVCSDASRIDPGIRNHLPLDVYEHLTTPLWGRLPLEALRRELLLNPPDLIHIQSALMYRTGVKLARLLRRPCVMSVAASPPRNIRLSEVGRQCARVIAISEAVRDDLIRNNRVRSDRIIVIPSGVDVPDLSTAGEILAPRRAPVVGTAGPLEISKGIRYFIEAAARIQRTHPDVEFLISGSGPEEHHLRRLVRDSGLAGKVTFVSSLYDFQRSITALDLFCLPSLQQGLGTTMLEAMALGRPVIASQVGGVDSIVTDGVTGLIVPPSDSVRLADRICELLDDPLRAKRIGEAGRQLVKENFQVGKMVEQTAGLYRDIMIESGIDLTKKKSPAKAKPKAKSRK
ncbi:glycosyltransferase family 4 protein [Calycomorphotria hydatis]|uniref:Alpha-D-kanosaminyltransferase n=1 Tax=Calycomorphotria hydatis TaxID=2528027 RepID=A0A517TBE7_9PLAN|nr:glycosyltransferase family 4 protein [Calycomorphotria hydatis]QDT65700.1 Alpha-D-kanosaminyltransferase [Calycomorphotria hydatis]